MAKTFKKARRPPKVDPAVFRCSVNFNEHYRTNAIDYDFLVKAFHENFDEKWSLKSP